MYVHMYIKWKYVCVYSIQSENLHKFEDCVMQEFRIYAHAASFSNVSMFTTMNTSAEEQNQKLFVEFCAPKDNFSGIGR